MPHQFYHIVCRENRRDPLFQEPNDFLAFLHILGQLHEKIPFEMASYCPHDKPFSFIATLTTRAHFENYWRSLISDMPVTIIHATA
ncbi:hypothetical protein PG301_19740 [Parageobacillus sp. G301]|nr:hypothetical protein PG301_19740 [Parageobacillus sp. G301]